MRRSGVLKRAKPARAPSAPAKPLYLVQNEPQKPANKAIKPNTSALKRSSTPNPLNRTLPEKIENIQTPSQIVSELILVMKKNKLLTRQQIAEIDNIGNELINYAKRV